MSGKYESSNIIVLEGLEAVRLRPGMYIGTTGIKGLHHILWEIVDNSMDEVANGFGNLIEITLEKDGSVTVEDNGRGIPVDIHPTQKKSGVEVVFTQLHAGGKFNNDNYSYSGGLHGVGASVTNALSRWLRVFVCKNGKKYAIEFSSFEDEKGKMKCGIPSGPLKEIGTSRTTGTRVEFMPDDRVFGDLRLDYDTISKRLRELAFLNKGVRLKLNDKKTGQSEEYCYEGGIKDFAIYLNEGKSKLYGAPVYLCAEDSKIKVELAFQHTDTYTDNIISYVNNIPTTEGGTHEVGFKGGFTKFMNDYARKNNLLKEKEANLIGEDFREGLTAVLSIKMTNIQFEGQTKTKLGNPEAKVVVEKIVAAELTKFFTGTQNNKTAEIIINKAKGAAKVREAARKAKEITRVKNSLDNYNLVGKLSNCTGRKPEQSELFIVEGDSAGGSAKQGRDRRFQAILPLKGKPLNAEKKRLDQVLANEEIRTIISSLETNIGADFNIKNLRYHKVIILSDADQDGAHIRAILCTFFFRYMKELITNGNVYIGLPPLYKVYKANKTVYVYSDEELPAAIKEVGRGYQIQRYKGLGEMNPEQLWETTMDPAKRTLVNVTLEDAVEAEKLVVTLMGDDINARKEYINKYANFNKVDEFMKRISN
ncbi:MAG: type IIA DNA topoisomerase subunit B [Clostridia bacterium]|nr:type IIA DNA topoisomerase subunit B [Clostridia bacterium]MBR3790571.1 type IIA DNA topoisomerase subunit B [Clostridia bacterium]